MVRRQILEAIADAVDRGEDESVAFAALATVDPLLRFWARRRFRLAITEALLTTPPAERADPEPQDEGHVLRLAYLSIAGATQPPRAQGTVATIQAFETTRRVARPAARHRWWLTGILGLATLLAVGCGGVLGLRALRGSPPLPADPPPPPAGAFAHGGVPHRGGPVLDRALGRDLPDFLIALDAWRRARGQGMPTGDLARRLDELEGSVDRLLARPVREALGEPAAQWLNWLLDLARALATTRHLDRLTKPYVQTVVALNDALAARGLGYYLDSDVVWATGDVRYVILYVFRVERVRRLSTGQRSVRALHLRRLDKLNWAHSALGFTRREHHEALVLLDSVDDILVTYLLPALGSSRLRLTDRATARAGLAWPAEISARAAAAIRGDLARLPGLTLEAAKRLAGLLARRSALIDRWQQRLGNLGWGMVEPTGLTFDWDYRKALRHVIGVRELDEMAKLDRALRAPGMRQALAALRTMVAASVAHHEAQHRLDYDWLASRALPAVLRRRLGPVVQRGRARPRVRRARDELSAYLAELARARNSTQLDLALIARFAFDQNHANSPECHAAQIILEGLAARLGLAPATGRGAGQPRGRDRYAMVYLRLTDADSATLRRAAQRLWEDLFGVGLPFLREVQSPPGR